MRSLYRTPHFWFRRGNHLAGIALLLEHIRRKRKRCVNVEDSPSDKRAGIPEHTAERHIGLRKFCENLCPFRQGMNSLGARKSRPWRAALS